MTWGPLYSVRIPPWSIFCSWRHRGCIHISECISNFSVELLLLRRVKWWSSGLSLSNSWLIGVTYVFTCMTPYFGNNIYGLSISFVILPQLWVNQFRTPLAGTILPLGDKLRTFLRGICIDPAMWAPRFLGKGKISCEMTYLIIVVTSDRSSSASSSSPETTYTSPTACPVFLRSFRHPRCCSVQSICKGIQSPTSFCTMGRWPTEFTIESISGRIGLSQNRAVPRRVPMSSEDLIIFISQQCLVVGKCMVLDRSMERCWGSDLCNSTGRPHRGRWNRGIGGSSSELGTLEDMVTFHMAPCTPNLR